jgi:uncharacterized protein YrrD
LHFLLVVFRRWLSSIGFFKEVRTTVAVGSEGATRETARLIARGKVEGSAVRGRDGETLGSIKRVVIDKLTGKVAYAGMIFDGFLGIHDEYRAVR